MRLKYYLMSSPTPRNTYFDLLPRLILMIRLLMGFNAFYQAPPITSPKRTPIRVVLHSIRKIFGSHRFDELHVEYLYQKYFLRLNISNLTSIVGLVIVLCIVILLTDHFVIGSEPVSTSISIGRLVVLPTVVAVLFIVELLLSRPYFNKHFYLIIISYVTLLMFFVLLAVLTFDDPHPSGTSAVWCTILFVFSTYILLPLSLIEAFLAAMFLSCFQLTSVAYINWSSHFIVYQVSHFNYLLALKRVERYIIFYY